MGGEEKLENDTENFELPKNDNAVQFEHFYLFFRRIYVLYDGFA